MAHGKNWKAWPSDIPGFLLPYADPYAYAITVIDEEHRLVHDGMAFNCSYVHGSLANAATLTMHAKVPAGCYPHIRACDVTMSDSPCLVNFYKDATLSADGTLVATQGNVNSASSNTAGLVMYHTPTITDPGTLVRTKYVPDMGGVGSNVVGAISSEFGEEIILSPGSWLLQVTNNSGAAIVVGFQNFWYELSYLQENA